MTRVVGAGLLLLAVLMGALLLQGPDVGGQPSVGVSRAAGQSPDASGSLDTVPYALDLPSVEAAELQPSPAHALA